MGCLGVSFLNHLHVINTGTTNMMKNEMTHTLNGDTNNALLEHKRETV